MLSKFKEISAYPQLSEPRTVRLAFCKKGALQYISHLDLQRTFMRILSRAELPLWYTQGFNPHPKLVFALPLPIGCESVCEMADIKLVRDMPNEDILARLHKATVEELDFFDCYTAERKFADIDFAEYVFSIDYKGDGAMADSIRTVLTTPPLYMTKKTKSGEKEIDIVPMIKWVEVEYACGKIGIKALLSAGSRENLSPEFVISAIRRRLLVLRDDENYSVCRTRICDSRTKTFR